jgi:hypothetical protein
MYGFCNTLQSAATGIWIKSVHSLAQCHDGYAGCLEAIHVHQRVDGLLHYRCCTRDTRHIRLQRAPKTTHRFPLAELLSI